MTIRLPGELAWFQDPTDPTSGLQLGIVTDDVRQRPITQDATVLIGDPQPVISSDVRQGQQSTLTWVVFTPTDRTALIALLNRGVTLMARFPTEQGYPGDVLYFRSVGTISEARYTQEALPGRTISTAWIERSRP